MVPAENVMRLLPDAKPPSADELARYFEACEEPCLRHLGRRPLTLVRSVEGVTFFHKGPLPPVPPVVRSLEIVKGDGSLGTRLWVEDRAGLLGLLEIDVVELHPWGATVDDIERPNRVIFDLDPATGVRWEEVCEAALRLRDFLAGLGLPSWPKTTGGKGLHLVVPTKPEGSWADIRQATHHIAETFAETDLNRYTSASGASARRGGRIFIDYLRNGRGQSAIGAMSPRAVHGGLVSTPLDWAEVEGGARPEEFTLVAVAERWRSGSIAPC